MMAKRSYSSDPVDVSFDLDGVTFTPGYVSLLDVSELMRFANIDVATPEGTQALGEFFEKIFGDDYEAFRAHCAKHRTRPAVMFRILEDVIEDMFAGFPTRAASDSSVGPPSTGRTLRVISPDGSFREEILTPERERELREAVTRAAAPEQATG